MSKYASAVDISRFVNEVHRRAENNGIGVEIDPEVHTACTDGNVVKLPTFVMPMTQREFERKRGQVIHEVGHINRPEIFDIIEETGLSMEHPLMRILNMVEDASQERVQARKYRGDLRALSDLHKHHTDDQIDYWIDTWKTKKQADLSPDVVKTMAIYAFSKEANDDWNIGANIRLRHLIETCHPDSVGIWEEARHEGWQTKIREATTPHESFEVSKELYNRFFDKDAEEEMDKAKDKKEGKDKGEEGETSEETSGEEGGEDGKDSSEELVEVDWDKILHSQHDSTSTKSSRINWEGKDKWGNFRYYPPDQTKTIILKDEVVHRRYKVDLPLEARLISNKVRQLIQATQRTQWKTDLKHGKINYSALYRRRMPRVGNGEWNRQLFKKKKQAKEIDTAVSVLVDWSGSMGGSKKKHAMQATTIMHNIFSRILSVPIEVLMFSVDHIDCTECVINGVVKTFQERTLSDQDITKRMYAMDRYTAGNADADSLMFAANRLVKRQEKRKILLVLSDGSPAEALSADDCHGDADAALQHTIVGIRKSTDIELHGIGIMDRNVRRYYGKHAQVIHKSGDLASCLIATLKEVVL